MTDTITVLKGGQLIDGNGGDPVADGVVVFAGDTITAAGGASEVSIPGGADVIDTTGKTIMPGLMDAHIHFLGLRDTNQAMWLIGAPEVRAARSVMDAWRVLDSGFTTVRDIGGMNGIFMKRAIEEGSIVGPRILASGKVISQTAGHGDWHFVPKEWSDSMLLGRLADGVSEVRKAAREQLREGADFLKIMTTGGVMSEKDKPTSCQYSMEEIRAFVEEARNADVKTATHAQGTQGIKNALIAGVDSIEHGFYLDDECIELMVKQGSSMVPTFAILDMIVTKGRAMGVMEVSVRKGEAVQADHMKSFLAAYKAGVNCGLGSDYLSDPMSPHGNSARELTIYVQKAGLSPMEAIVCATRNNAKVFGLEDRIGTIEAGKQADLLVVDGDPLADISILEDKSNLSHIFKSGAAMPRLPEGI
jgi:imidazolonepropionase-like amidohydrolase